MSLPLIGGCAPKPPPPIGCDAGESAAQYIHIIVVMYMYDLSAFTHHFRSVFIRFHTSEWPTIVIYC